MNIQDLRSQLTAVLNFFDTTLAGFQDDLSPWMGMSNFTKSQVRQDILNTLNLAQRIRDSGDGDGFTEHCINIWIAGNITPLNGYIQGIPGNPQSNIQNIISTLFSIRQSMVAIFPQHLLSPDSYEAALQGISDSESKIREAVQVAMELNGLAVKARQSYSDFDGEYQRSKNAVGSIVAFQETAVSSSESINRALDVARDVEGKIGKLEQDSKKIASLAEAAQVYYSEIEDTLAASKRKGLASAFSKRAEDMKGFADKWRQYFFSSLLGLVFVGALVILPHLYDPGFSVRFDRLLFGLPLTAPLIWMAWYSGVRYSGFMKVWEDYEFKAATALSIEGYKREVSVMDEELARDLMEISIKNFAENPIRLYEKGVESVSPIHSAIEACRKIIGR